MNVSQMLDKYIEQEGKGNARDALNVALARSSAMANQLLILSKSLRELDDNGWTLLCAQQVEQIVETYKGEQ